MEAKTFVTLQINRLQDLLSEEAITDNPTLVKDVVTAIKGLDSFEQKLPVSSAVQAAYRAEDITDSLLIRKELRLTRNRENNGFINTLLRRKDSRPTRKREKNGSKKKNLWPFKSSHSRSEFALELKKFRTEITALSTRENVFGSNDDATLSFQNKEVQQSRHQRWENFPEEETNIVGFEQEIKELVAQLIPQTNCNSDLSSTRDRSGEDIVEISAEQDAGQRTQVITEIDERGSGETINTHDDNKPSDVYWSEKKYFWMSLKNACERYLRRILSITLLQSSIAGHDGNQSTNQVTTEVGEEIREDQIPEQDGNQSTSQVAAGIVADIQEDQIPEQDGNHSTNQVIAVVGKAGSGKSTLARTVYNRIDVKQHFPMRAWVRVSWESEARDVLLSILKQINTNEPLKMGEEFSEEVVKSSLKQRLKDMNYLIVIEDVEKPQVWRDVLNALNNLSCHGGKIIITCRSADATPNAGSTVLICPLNDDESWKLFSNKVPLAQHPEVMSTIVKEEILKVCGGLPLRMVLLGGLLSTKQPNDLLSVIDEIAGETNRDILVALSYEDLPSQLKPCFLYIGLFPKEYEIPVRRLIHLWCAEGFVTPNSKEMVAEDLAELYFRELVIRNMIKVRWSLDGSPKTCRMHDYLHDTFSKKAMDVGFFYHDQFQQSLAEVKQPQFSVRRLTAAYLDNSHLPSSFLDLRHLHSCLIFDTRRETRTPASQFFGFLNKIVVNRDFVLLKVLDLEGVHKPKLSEAVEELLQLRYLGLRSTFIDSLPSFVGFLPYLETLDLKNTRIEKLPCSIWKAKKMQHLYLDWSNPGIVVDSSFPKSLSSLRTLWGLCIKDDGSGKFDSTSALKIVTQLTQLQSLKVKLVQGKSAARLRRQSMGKTSGTPHLQLQSMEKLQKLYLMGKLEKQVIDVRFLPPNLRILTLSGSRLEEDPMPVLEKLFYLKTLRLFPDSYIGREMKCSLEGFPQLHVLKLWKLEQLERWTVEEGAMPCLRDLEIKECNQLRVPMELQRYLTT